MAYIERNPVRAGLVESAEDYPWSSASAHVRDRDDSGVLEMAVWRAAYTTARWRDALRIGVEDEALGERIRSATIAGRPFGSDEFTTGLELTAHRRLRPDRAGRRKKSCVEATQPPLELEEIGE
jgi:putative transposase